MTIDFGNDKKSNKRVVGIYSGGFSGMMTERKKQLPDIEKNVREILKNYDGGGLVIIKMCEDENGLPTGSDLLMTGVTGMEVMMALGKALNEASNTAIEVLMEGANGNPKALMAIASALLDNIEKETDKEKK